MLEKAKIAASSADIFLNKILRYDLNIINGISSVIREQNITDLVIGLHLKKNITDPFLGNLTEGIIDQSNPTIFIYRSVQPISTIRRHFVVVPENAEYEIGFPFWLIKIWNIARNMGAKILFYGAEKTISIIREVKSKHPIEAEFHHFDDWNDFLILSRDIKVDDNLLIVMSRPGKLSYHENMSSIPSYLNKYFQSNSFIMLYPMQSGVSEQDAIDFNNPSLLEPIEKVDELGKTIAKLFRRR
jgi:hypothetical protein